MACDHIVPDCLMISLSNLIPLMLHKTMSAIDLHGIAGN